MRYFLDTTYPFLAHVAISIPYFLNYRCFMKKIIFFCIFLFYSCTAFANPRGVIRIYDNAIYQNIKTLLYADFTKHGIVTEEIPGFNPINLFNLEWGAMSGKNLYEKIALSFMYPSHEESKNWTFKNFRHTKTKAKMYSHGFVLEQGLQKITLSLLGELHWNEDSISDWLIYCRVDEMQTKNKITKNNTRHAREYFLIISDRSGTYWQAKPFLIRDLTIYSQSTESKIYRNITKQLQLALEPNLAIDFEEGQEQIVDSSTNKKEKNKELETLNEQSLSE